jgi:hypothetical protein
LFTYRLALQLGIWDVEDLKRRISRRQLRKWLAFYLIEPWGQSWLLAGRMTSLIRNAFTGKYDRHDEERFLITYREGDEHRSKVPLTDEQLAAKLAAIPGLKKKKKKLWRPSEKSGQSSPPQPPASSPE